MEDVLVVENVGKIHGRLGRSGVRALDGASLTVASGELFGLLGPNGAGKTTLVTILCGLTEPTSGTARVLGTTPSLARHRVGLATQELSLYPDLTGRENVRFFARLYGLRGQALQSRTDEILAAMGLSEKADHRVASYSGGMKRRLNLGIAIVHSPRLLFLDEPTTGVDPQSRNHIFETIRGLHRDGVTIIYSSHYMEEVQSLCDRIAILDNGRVIACDRMRNLLGQMEGRVMVDVLGVSDTVLTELAGLPGVAKAMREADELTIRSLHPGDVVPGVMEVLTRAGLRSTRVLVHEPTLEQVFLELTGRALRDE